MARRSSARLRGRNSSTPQRVSLSQDAQPQTPRTAPVKLTALHESDEMPGAFPGSTSPPPRSSSHVYKQNTSTVPVNFNGTPKDMTPIKPAEEEMHPKQHQQSTAKPMEEARWLGFSNMHPQTEPPKQSNKAAHFQGTPSRTSKVAGGMDSPKFRFTFNREQSLELSPAAKRLMEETREEAARIREQMISSGEAAHDADMAARKIATPKSRKGRFSDAHTAQFSKMDSIASHPSIRSSEKQQKAPLNINVSTPGQKTSKKATGQEASPSKSLKRKQSKAELDESDRYPTHSVPRSTAKPAATNGLSQLPRPTSTSNLFSPSKAQATSPAKRMKPTVPDASSNERSQPATPQTNKSTSRQPHYPDMSNLASPTQASLARAASVKSNATTKIPGPGLTRSPSKQAPQTQHADSPKPSTPLLARSPSKAALFEQSAKQKSAQDGIANSPLLSRSPTKAPAPKRSPEGGEGNSAPKSKEAPLLARSPMKGSISKSAEPKDEEHKQATSTPLLQRSPAKVSLMDNKDDQTATSPGKAGENGLMGRLNLLRSSPMKSILRSPQRLYSNDPAKVAAGTHLATPPKFTPKSNPSASPSKGQTPAGKHVDFSSSTKARYERAQSELSSTPSKGSTPSSKQPDEPAKSPTPTFASYPDLPTDSNEVLVTPQKRRQTAVPGDFTFKAGEHSISFGPSPNAPASTAGSKRPSTIRHVSVEPELLAPQSTMKKRKFEYENAVAAGKEDDEAPVTTAKKRKFEYENALAAGGEERDEKTTTTGGEGGVSDKENEEVERPAKRLKKSAMEVGNVKPAAKAAPTKRPTLGVKPKNGGKERKPSVISKARLDALSQPKRRT